MTGGDIGGLVVVVFGVTIAAVAARESRRGEQSAAWPTVGGVVVMSRVVEDDEGAHRADVTYEYKVAGRVYVYQGTRIRFGYRGGHRRGPAEELAAAYPVGRQVAVHYDPGWPQESVLRPGGDPATGRNFLLGVLIVVVGLISFATG